MGKLKGQDGSETVSTEGTETEGGVADKVERKNQKSKDTLTFHSAEDEAPPTEDAEPAEETPSADGEEVP